MNLIDTVNYNAPFDLTVSFRAWRTCRSSIPKLRTSRLGLWQDALRGPLSVGKTCNDFGLGSRAGIECCLDVRSDAAAALLTRALPVLQVDPGAEVLELEPFTAA
jgi:hypothetical protein